MTTNLTIELLQKHLWQHPPSYGGHSPVGDYLIYSRHRESEILINVNYNIILKDLEVLDAKYRSAKDESKVYDFRVKCWAYGWQEYIIVKKDAAAEVLAKAEEILDRLEVYPILDECAYSAAQEEEIYRYWESLSLQSKIDYCNDCGVSIFAARRGYACDKVYDKLLDAIY